MPKPPTPFPELHSEEIQEIINRPPSWLVHSGISLFLALLSIFFASCWMIKYPDVIPATFTLVASNAPRSVITRSDGKLQRILVRDGQHVNQQQILAFMESTASHEQINLLEKNIQQLATHIEQGHWESVNRLSIDSYDMLGEIQGDFQAFAQNLAKLKTFLNCGYHMQKRSLLQSELADFKDLEQNIIEQLQLQRQDLTLGKDEFKVQERLFGDRVISSLEYKKEKSKLLAREMPVKSLTASLIQNRSSQTAKRKEILELDNAIAESKANFRQALQTFKSNIEFWKQQYVLLAPVAGRVSFAAPWQEQQHLTVGQELLTIEPPENGLRGLVKLSQGNLGKIKEGQKVLIKLDGYPYHEFGLIEGTLSKISTTPGRDSSYWGYVALPHQLKTEYGRKLTYRSGLSGTAEVVTADRRLITRLISTMPGSTSPEPSIIR
jgi:multidrug resistance efflux pump